MSKKNVKRVVCVYWNGLYFTAGHIYCVNENGKVINKDTTTGYPWYRYDYRDGASFRPAYTNDNDVESEYMEYRNLQKTMIDLRNKL